VTPRRRDEDLVGVEHHLTATGPGDVRREVAEQHRPPEDRPQQAQGDRVLGQVGEDR
jgi:hypothetical protein